jgi:hypothetical protein
MNIVTTHDLQSNLNSGHLYKLSLQRLTQVVYESVTQQAIAHQRFHAKTPQNVASY